MMVRTLGSGLREPESRGTAVPVDQLVTGPQMLVESHWPGALSWRAVEFSTV
jgi:hypothetical protein